MNAVTLLAVAAFWAVAGVRAGWAATQGPDPFDARIAYNRSLVVPRGAQSSAAIQNVRAQLPGVRVRVDAATGARSLSAVSGYLTEARSGEPRDVAIEFMQANAAALGLAPDDLTAYEVTDQVRSRRSGASHLYLRQLHLGIPVYDGQLQVNVNRDGRISSVHNAFMPDVGNAANSANPGIDAAGAIASAAEHLGVAPQQVPQGVITGAGPSARITYTVSALSTRPVIAQLMWLPIRSGELRLVWNFQVHTMDHRHIYDFTVDARTGTVWTRFDWVARDSYRVFELPAESPNHAETVPPDDGRTLAVDPEDAVASPFGWHDTDGVAGPEFVTLQGNNVHAYEDSDDDDAPPVSEPTCSAGLVCDFDNPIDFGTQEPGTYVNAAITNLFYWNNVVHDVTYQYGFDEGAGNFQANTYGRGGLGGDAVNAEGQDGGFIGNANFATLPDGFPGRMQMYLWDDTNPGRDGDFDNGVVAHEYGHGVSNRLVGGPAAASCLTNLQQPGEGWSDWLALALTAEPGDTGTDPRGIGTYVLGDPLTGPGIRTQRYSTDPAVNTHTYASIAGMLIPHGVGEVWAQGLWEMYWALVDEHGYDANLYDAGGGAGNQRAMLYVIEGMQNTPCLPTFVDARDGILQAVQDNYGGEDLCTVWTAFAGFGLGVDAIDGGADSTTPTNGFDLPPQCGGPLLGDNFAAGVAIAGIAGSRIIDNTGATGETGEPVHAGAGNSPPQSVWFEWIAPAEMQVEMDTAGSTIDTVLAVYTGNTVDTLTEVASNNDTGGTVTSRVSFRAAAGTTYHVAVDGAAGLVGSITLNWGLSTTHNLMFLDAPSNPLAINSTTPCGGAEITRTINVPDDVVVNDPMLGFGADHTWRGDIQVTVQAPGGAAVTVIGSDLGDSDANYDVTASDGSLGVLDDGLPDDTGPPYFERSVAPAGALNTLNGNSARGNWVITVCDSFPALDHGHYFHSLLVPRQSTDPADLDGDGSPDDVDRDDDQDGMPDYFESAAGLDPRDASDAGLDADNDGLSNADEFLLGTNLNDDDSDDDGLGDGFEVDEGLDPLDADSDNDGLQDGFEVSEGLDPLDGLCPEYICGAGTWRRAIR